VCLPEAMDRVEGALRETPGVIDMMTSGLGVGARLESKP